MRRFSEPGGSQGGGGDDAADLMRPRAVRYVTTVLKSLEGKDLAIRDDRELRNLAECLDALLRGDLPHLGDVLMQRLKSVETKVKDKSWHLANHLELIPPSTASLVSPEERHAAGCAELRAKKLADLSNK